MRVFVCVCGSQRNIIEKKEQQIPLQYNAREHNILYGKMNGSERR
jgi:hypothetical protein